MTQPTFVDGVDKTTFAPFELIDCRDTEWGDVRLSFDDWDGLRKALGSDSIDGYYMNGYGVQGLVFAARLGAGLDPFPPGMEPDSEANTCFLCFQDFDLAVETADLAREMINDESRIRQCIALAREHDFED